MIDALREEEIVRKVGGRFKLSTLIQKRLVALNAGARPLVEVESGDRMQIVVQEILDDKIFLDTSGNVRITGEQIDGGGPPEFDLSELQDPRERPMQGRELIVGVTGGIAAYKTAMLVSQLVQAGASVQVVMTDAAHQFVGEATFTALTGRPVATRVFDDARYPLGAHIELALRADLLCVAPATASFLAKLAHGLSDDLLSTLALAMEGPVLVAPAMNSQMWEKPAVARNVAQLRADGVHVVDPESGWLSCRQQGVGRMAAPETIAAAIGELLKDKPAKG